jgi:hypothetical protein
MLSKHPYANTDVFDHIHSVRTFPSAVSGRRTKNSIPSTISAGGSMKREVKCLPLAKIKK